jgi:hypothetical protein
MYLLLATTNERVKAEIIVPTQLDLDDIKSVFGFDWRSAALQRLYAIRVIDDKQIVGLIAILDVPPELRLEVQLLESSEVNVGQSKMYKNIAGCLLAYACREAFLKGYYGFVSLVPKTELIEHYKSKYGFQQYGRHLAVEFESAQNLIQTYLSYEK